MDKSSMKLSGFCHSCSLSKTLDKIILSHRSFQPDLNEKFSQAEFFKELFQNVDELKEIGSGNCLALNNFKYSGHSKETPTSCALVEWKTMETSMEDGLLGRAAVSRTSNEHTPWEMSRTHADSSDNFFQFDSLHYGTRQDYIRRLRKASMIKELKEAGYSQEFFEGIYSKSFPQYRNPPNWNGEWFDSDLTLIQEAPENNRIEERDDELTNTSSIVESLCVERSQEDLTKKNNAVENTSNFLPCQENEAEVMNSETGVQDRQRRHRRFPPPLHSLRKTSSLLPHKVPLQLLQPIRSKGRFILQEVQVASQMVFQPIRKDGRLQLRLFRNGNKNTEQHSSQAKSADVEFTAVDLSPALELNIEMRSAAVGDSGGRPTQINKDEENYSSVTTEEASARNLASKETESVQATGEESVAPAETKPVQEMLRIPSTTQGTRAYFKVQKLGSRHLGVLQTMQQILFQTIQHHYDKEYQNELIRSFAARALKLTLCRAALRSAEKKSTTYTNSRNIISKTRVNSVGKNGTIRYINTYENSFNNERDPDDSTPKLFQIPHICIMLDSQDPSMQQCRYKGNIRQGDEGISALWEAHCIAT